VACIILFYQTDKLLTEKQNVFAICNNQPSPFPINLSEDLEYYKAHSSFSQFLFSHQDYEPFPPTAGNSLELWIGLDKGEEK
jgi:hypothetical protein